MKKIMILFLGIMAIDSVQAADTVLTSNSKRPILLEIYDTKACPEAIKYQNSYSRSVGACVDGGILGDIAGTYKSLKAMVKKKGKLCEPYQKVLCYGESHTMRMNTLLVASKKLAKFSLANPAPLILHLSYNEPGGEFYIQTIKSESVRGVCSIAGDFGLRISATPLKTPDDNGFTKCEGYKGPIERAMKTAGKTEPGL